MMPNKKDKLKTDIRPPKQKTDPFPDVGKNRQKPGVHPVAEYMKDPPPAPAPIPISPVNNYTKRPNSETFNAIPEGFFRSGRSMEVYAVLYDLTRGSFPPKRTIQISRKELMKRSRVGAVVTIKTILDGFCQNGLLKIDRQNGRHGGNVIEVFIYEEISGTSGTSATSATSGASGASFLPGLAALAALETSAASPAKTVENKGENEALRLLKIDKNKNDDERAAFFDKFEAAAEAATGKAATKADYEGLDEILSLVIAEANAAASRTGSVSSYGKFAAEHLRRRLLAKPVIKSEPVRNPGPGKETRTNAEIILEEMREAHAAGQEIDFSFFDDLA